MQTKRNRGNSMTKLYLFITLILVTIALSDTTTHHEMHTTHTEEPTLPGPRP